MEASVEESDQILEQNPDIVYTLDFSIQNLQCVPKSICKYVFCKSLNLACNQITSIKKDDFSSLIQLKELKLYSNKLETVNGLQHFDKLEELHLQFNNISSIGNSFKKNKSLTFLRLDSNKLSVIKSAELCMLSKLTYLDVSSNQLDDIACVSALTSLERLYSTHNILTKLPNLFPLKKLKEVDFSFNRLTNVSSLKGCNKLQVIVLNSNMLKSLISVGSLKMLQDLKICDNLISDLKHISEQFSALEVLEISGNKIISPAEVKFLSTLSSTLKEVSIYSNPILMDNDQKALVYNTLENNLQLDVLDRTELHKEKGVNNTTCIMRPMSATQIISQRTIKNQMDFSEMTLAEFEDKIKLQFNVLRDSLMVLPTSKPPALPSKTPPSIISSLPQTADLNKSDKRPARCNSRARLEEARAFAEKHF